jgi:site-specific DNA recombinase
MTSAATYSRYSTDRQNESSIADQNRVCGEWCAREGISVAARFEDQGISGAAIGNRPGFLAMMEAALAARFDVLVVMDLTRLSRSQGDLSKMIDRMAARGVRVIGVQDGYDSARKGHKLQVGLSGIIGEAFREMVSERTYTALQSRAMQGRPAGGKRYGYADGESETVRQVFEWYADGYSAQWIAAELNRRGIASPGSTWRRSVRRRGGWHPSAIGGDLKRGIGLLNNEAYIGRMIWNRSRWIKDPDTGKRRCVLRPRNEWIVTEDESGRIVPQRLWERVKARQRLRAIEVGEKISGGLKGAGGHGPRYLFSGLMRCESCGSSFVMKDKHSYQCSGFVNGRICDNGYRVRRDLLEDRLLVNIKTELLTDESIERFTSKIRRRMMQRPLDPLVKRRKDLEAEVGNLSDAIATGLLSPSLAKRLQDAESELAALRAPLTILRVDDVLRRLPDAVKRFRQMVARLGDVPIDMERGRAAVKGLIGPIWIARRDGYLVAKMGLECQPLLGSSIRGSGGRI